MASAAFPSVITAVLSTARDAVTGARVVRGRDVSADPSDVVMIGIGDAQALDDVGYTSAGTFQQSMQTFGGNREEVGLVNGLIVATNGEEDPDLACATAFDYLAAIEAQVRADPTLGLTFEYVVAELQAGDVSESPNGGASVALSFSITYKIRI